MTVKQQARELIDNLPDSISWEDLLYEIYVRQKIAQGLADVDAGRTYSQEEIEREFLR